jgi:hypothetical protein
MAVDLDSFILVTVGQGIGLGVLIDEHEFGRLHSAGGARLAVEELLPQKLNLDAMDGKGSTRLM